MRTQTLKQKLSGWRRRLALRSLQNESGIALVVALLFMIIMISLVPVATQMTTGDKIRVTNFEDSKEAFFLADAGVEHAKNEAATVNNMDNILRGMDDDASTTSDNGMGPLMDPNFPSNETTYTFHGQTNTYTAMALKDPATNATVGTYYVRAYDNNDEGLATNNAMDDTDGIIYVESVGVSNDGTIKAVRAMLQKIQVIPKLPAAVTMVGPLSEITSTGSGFLVAGGLTQAGTITHGSDISGNVDPNCPAANGIATESVGPMQYVGDIANCTDPTCAEFAGNAGNKIQGATNGTPDIINGQTDFTAQDAQELHDLLIGGGVYDTSLSSVGNGAQTESSNDVWGTPSDPKVVYFDDGLDIQGTIDGAGILVIDGDLNITGDLNWDGIVLIGSCTTCNGALVGTGSAEVDGAMVVGNSIDAAVNFTGNADIRYSCEGIGLANLVFGSPITVASWKEM